MGFTITVCQDCLGKVENCLGGPDFHETGKVNMAGEREYEVAMASDPATAAHGSLFMQAWRGLPGHKNGNNYICPHTMEYLLRK